MLTVAARVNTENTHASNQALNELLGECLGNQACEPLLDVMNYIDYMILNFYGGTGDWPTKNWIAIDRAGDDTGFQFIPWDAEISLHRGSPLDTDRTNLQHGVAELYSNLRANARFREMFAERVHLHFSEAGALYVAPEHEEGNGDRPSDNLPAARYAELANAELVISKASDHTSTR